MSLSVRLSFKQASVIQRPDRIETLNDKRDLLRDHNLKNQ